ncbi:phosphoenolpyruvate--protein phosphotransferase [Halomonas halmophila]|uniref:phosphoenolpyruvate--protein phosphotransferase n=1 Tax=Halomonas halmophila TaxID=252 RepID=A0A4Y4F3J1_9GAMM|nr:phosphoenolpyruvate--protein phosphotransferase [Halomonas halmophila]GED21698.1 phosphoenolpyruvate--protein phosphotransferase [Halomonas halmophila]
MSACPLSLVAPVTGITMRLGDVPDPVFAGGELGQGVALDPLEASLHAPCDGEVVQCARTGHALSLRTEQGIEVLLHLGLDTVELQGEGIELLVEVGQWVKAGDELCRFDPELLAERARSLITPLVVTDAAGWQLEHVVDTANGRVERGEPLMHLVAAESSEAAVQAEPMGAWRERSVSLALENGLHARPAARLRAIVQRHAVEMRLLHAATEANAASVSALMNLGLSAGSRVVLQARGEAAEAALDGVVLLLTTPEGVQPVADAAVPSVPSAEVDEGEVAGLVASPGLAIGKPMVLSLPLPEVPYAGRGEALEREALEGALQRVGETLESAREQAVQRGRNTEAEIIEAHLAWLEDPGLSDAARARIEAGRGGGQAWREALDEEAERLRATGNALLAGRVADLHDLQRHVMAEFAESDAAPTFDLPEGAILLAVDLSPSQFVDLLEYAPAGLCLKGGGVTSHVAILARSRGIPCLVAMGDALDGVKGEQAVLDAQAGRLETAPDDARLATVRRKLADEAERRAVERAEATSSAVTRDGRSIEVAANIGNSDEAYLAAESGADGIGLMRSEFLFLGRDSAPDEAEQRREYQTSLAALDGKPVIIRTLDIGADKQLAYLRLPEVPNPALGVRGVRLWHDQPQLLDTQLRALLGVEPLSTLHIMLPMVSEAGEVARVRERLEAIATQLGVVERPRLGAMVEIPSAALCAASLAETADFLSIGTNDLTQYALAMDREDPHLASRADVLHPGVLRLIQATLEGAAGRCPVGVCGAAAGDPLAAALLVAMGVDELSVEPARVAAVKAEIRRLDAASLAREVPALLAMPNAESVRRRLAERHSDAATTISDSTTTISERTSS